MKILLVLFSLFSLATAFSVPEVSRRNALAEATGIFTFLASTAPANAATGAEAFVGTFADPINHPGGKRTIQLVGERVGEYQLAQVVGGGGQGEPAEYVLPAAIFGGRTIVIDFSVPPKYGPKDFVGVLDSKGNIKFLKDGNTWPRI